MRFFSFFDRITGRTSELHLFNTLTRQKERFELLHGHVVRMYNCGPTVYDRQHIGNLAMFVFTDILKRTLQLNDFTVKQVINFTDVGHLSGDNIGDADAGEDRMTKGMKRDGIDLTLENMKLFGKKYADIFLDDIRALNIDTDTIIFPYASDYIPAQIAMVETLIEKGYAYTTKDGVYFDTSRFAAYGALGSIDTEHLQEGARVKKNDEKHNPTDFAIWKFNRKLGWKTPWGKGFPGWHLECSAMINSILGKQIDIHTGGIEHIGIHHNNEIAQSEAATGKAPLSRFWIHREHILMNGTKLAKSTGNTAYLSDIVSRGIHPLSYRYWLLTSHYRSQSNFTWEALLAAQQAYIRMQEKIKQLHSHAKDNVPDSFKNKFRQFIDNDLDTAGALALLWDTLLNADIPKDDRMSAVLYADRIFGLQLGNKDITDSLAPVELEFTALSEDAQRIARTREEVRARKEWAISDNLRDELKALGVEVKDSKKGQRFYLTPTISPTQQS